jgi:predicted nucleotidyltransferase
MVRKIIQKHLQDIEAEKDVRIVYACESGSRAWGFASADSDYDVRFIYVHPVDWYLSVNLESKSDVIECARPDGDLLDVSGWDLRKALQLLRKGNPPLIEWLGSPTVYLDKHGVADRMRTLMQQYYSPIACAYHYLHMAQGNYRVYLKGSTVWVKKYFYVLRPLLAIRWIEQGFGIVPMEFQTLVDTVVDSAELQDEIAKLVESKRQGEELKWGPRVEPINEFIRDEFARLVGKQFKQDAKRAKGSIDAFNGVFRIALAEVWNDRS